MHILTLLFWEVIKNICGFFREKKIIPDSVKQEYLKKAQDYGCNIAQLVWVEQDKE